MARFYAFGDLFVHFKAFAFSVFLASTGAILFSAKAILVKASYKYGVEASTVLALRMLLAQPFFWAAVLWQRQRESQSPVTRSDQVQMLFLGFLGYYVSSYFDFWGLQFVTVGLERLIIYLTPTCVLLISLIWFKESIHPRQWIAMVIAYLGVSLVFFEDVRLEGPHVAWGALLVFISTVTYALYLIRSERLVSRLGSIRIVAYASASAAFFSLIHALIENPVSLISQPREVYELAMLNASLCTFVPMLFVMMAVNRFGSGLTAQCTVVGPIATVFLGWYFLGETVNWLQMLGMAVVLASMAVLLTVRPAAESR